VPIHQADATVDWIENLAKELGLSFQPKNMIHPTTSLDFLGVGLDSAAMEAWHPHDKLAYLCKFMLEWDMHRQCNLRELQ